MKKFSNEYIMIVLLVMILSTINTGVRAQSITKVNRDTLTQTVIIHPVIEGKHIVSSEHEYDPDLRLGDQLARDFSIARINDQGILRRFKDDGHSNREWYGWRKDVLAPVNGTVTRVNHPDTTNQPGVMNRNARPGLIFFKRADGTTVIYAHVREIKVEEGDQVKAGEVVAKVGNNGNSRAPHVHAGAWREDTPLQIQVDLYAAGRDKKSGI